ncbi:MAG: EamA family transporter [candidate division WOR-3 bacterium]
MNYLILSIITLIAWGFWGFFSKFSTYYYRWYEYFIFSSIMSLFFSTFLFFLYRKDLNFRPEGLVYLLLALFSGTIGTVFFYLALTKGKASIIVPLTSLYPAFTLILARIFLKEELSLQGYIGIILAIFAILLLSRSS